MGARSRRKGKRGELELARALTDAGFPARRGRQFSGSAGSPDVVCDALRSIHFEAKRSERLSVADAMAQARTDCGEKLPVVAWRRNRGQWIAFLDLADLCAILRASSHHEQAAAED